jgi:hypothetical protein
MSVITINGNSFDPAGNAVRAFGLESVDVSRSNSILIQTSGGPLKKEQKEALRKKDIKIYEYASKDTHLCGYKPEDPRPYEISISSNMSTFTCPNLWYSLV